MLKETNKKIESNPLERSLGLFVDNWHNPWGGPCRETLVRSRGAKYIEYGAHTKKYLLRNQAARNLGATRNGSLRSQASKFTRAEIKQEQEKQNSKSKSESKSIEPKTSSCVKTLFLAA